MENESFPAFLKCCNYIFGITSLAFRIKLHRMLKGFQHSAYIEVAIFRVNVFQEVLDGLTWVWQWSTSGGKV